MTPYYSDALVTLYHADCREVLPSLTPGCIDGPLPACPRCSAREGEPCRDYRGKRKATCRERAAAARPPPEPERPAPPAAPTGQLGLFFGGAQ